LGRTPGSVALKLTNLASIDETLDRKGMSNYSKLDKAVWETFFDTLALEAAKLPPGREENRRFEFADHSQGAYQADYAGTSTPRIVNIRQGQQMFRSMVLTSYASRCAITGIAQPQFLVAGHIRSWAQDPENRLNPRNGICLNRLHDKAFEDGLIAISEDWQVLYSPRLEATARRKMEQIQDTGLFRLPDRFRPDQSFLKEHRDHRFQQ